MVPVVAPHLGCVISLPGALPIVAAVMVVCAVAVQVLSAVLLIVMVFAPTLTPLKMLEAWKVVQIGRASCRVRWAGAVTVMVPVVDPQIGCVTLNHGVGGGGGAV